MVRDTWFTRVYSIGGHSYAKIRPWNRLSCTRKRIPSSPPFVARFTRDAESAGRPCCTCNVISRGVSSTPLLLYRRVSGSFNKISLPSRLGRSIVVHRLLAIRDPVSIISLQLHRGLGAKIPVRVREDSNRVSRREKREMGREKGEREREGKRERRW